MKVSDNKASKKVKNKSNTSVKPDSTSKQDFKKKSDKKASTIKKSKTKTNKVITKQITKSTTDSNTSEISQEKVVEMTSQMMNSMNEKLKSLELIKKNLEDKLKEVDSKVSRTELNSKSVKPNSQISKKVSNLSNIQEGTQKEVEEILLIITTQLKQLHTLPNSSQTTFKLYIELLEKNESELEILIKKLNSKKLTPKEIKTITKDISLKVKEFTNSTQKQLMTVVQKNPISTNFESKNVLDELTKSKKHLEYLISKKTDAKELHTIIEPIENRINSTIKTLELVEQQDLEKFKKLQEDLINSKQQIESQIINLEKEEHKKVSKKQYREDIIHLQNELSQMIEVLHSVDSKEKKIQTTIAQLQKEELALNSLIHTINERSSLLTTKEDVSKEIRVVKNEITNAFKSIEELNFLEQKQFKTIKTKLNSKFKNVQQKFDELDEKYVNVVSKDEFSIIKKQLNTEIKTIIDTLKRADLKEKHLEDEFSSIKSLVNSMSSEKIDILKLKEELAPINKLILNLKQKDSKQINSIRRELEQSMVITQDKISKIEEEESKKIPKEIYKKDIHKLHLEIQTIVNDLEKSNLDEKELAKHVKVLEISKLKLEQEIAKLSQKESQDVSKEYIVSQINIVENQINNAFKAIEQSRFFEQKELKSLKDKLNKKFTLVVSNFNDLNKKYSNVITTKQFKEHKDALKQEVLAIVDTLQRANLKEKSLEHKFKSIKEYVDSLNVNKVDIEELKKELDPLNKLILNVKRKDSREISNIKKELENSVLQIKGQITKIEEEEKKKVSKSGYKKDMNKLHEDIGVIITDLEKSNMDEKELSKHVKALELSKIQIEKEIKSLSLKESKDVSKEYVSSQIAMIENQINNAFKAIEQSRFFEQKELKSLKDKLNKKFTLVVSNFEDLNKKYSNAVTTKQFKEHKNVLRQEVLAIVDTLQRANIKEKTVEKQLKNLSKLEQNLENSISTIETQLKSKVELNELDTFEKDIHLELQDNIKKTLDEISNIKSMEEKDVKELKSKINKRIVTIQNIITSFNSHHNRVESSIQREISTINSTIREVITTLKRASAKEKNLEELISKLEEVDREEVEKIEEIQKRFKSYYTKKQLNHMLEHINEEYEQLKLEMITSSQEQSNNLHELEYSLQEQKNIVENQINDLNNVHHKTFATKSFTSKQLKDLKTLENVHNEIQKQYIDGIENTQKLKDKEHQLRVEALRNSLSELYYKSSSFMTKSQAKIELKELYSLLDELNSKESSDTSHINTKLTNLANTFSKEISIIFKDIDTLSSKDDVEKVKNNLVKKLQETSKEIQETQELLNKESSEQTKKLKKEHLNLLNVEKSLNSKVEALHMSLLENYYTKAQINSIKKEFNTELEKLHSIQDASISIVEDELTDLYQTTLSHQKKLSTINKKIKHDEDVMSTHQEVIDVSAALQETLKHSKTQLQKKSTQQVNELMQEIKALLSSESDREKKVQELNRKVQKTYSKDQLDKAFLDVADEVERIKLHEEEEFKQIKQKELRDVSDLTSKTKELESHTQIDYLKEHLTQELEKRVQELKEEQLRHYDEISKIQAHEQRLDTTEDLIAQKEELLEQKIQNQFEVLEQAKTHWEEFFTNIKTEIEADEDSLSKALSSIEVLKQDLKSHNQEISQLKQSQTPLKQYLVEKYNILVDAFHKMQREQKLYEEELKKSQDDLLLVKLNEYNQEIYAYQNQIKELQASVDEYIDSKNAHTYKEFEQSMDEYKNKYTQEIIQVQTSIQQYLEQIKSDEKEYSNLMKQYIDKVNTKIVEVNELETNFEDLLRKAKEEVSEYIHNSIDKIELSVESIVNSKTDEFLQREITLLASYHEKIQYLEDLTNKRLDKIEDKFIEKHTQSIRHKINEEVASIDSKIDELKSLQKESLEHEERIEEKLLNQVQEIDTKSDETKTHLMEIVDNFKEEFFHLEREAEKLRDGISQKVEERITHFEQHLNKRYLESDQEIAYIKETLVNEIEGLMRDVAQELENKKLEVDSYINSTLQGKNVVDTIEYLKTKVEQLEFNEEGLNANLVFGSDSTSKNTQSLNYYVGQIEDLKNKFSNLQAQVESNSAVLTFADSNYYNQNSNYNENLSTQNDINEKLRSLEAEQERLNVQETLTPQSNVKEVQDYMMQKLNLFEEEFSIIKSQVQANSAFQTLNNEFDLKLKQLFNNQKKLAEEFKKNFTELKNKVLENSAQNYHLQKNIEDFKNISNVSDNQYATDSYKLVHTMKYYENDLIDSIKELHKNGHSKEEIEYILTQKGHPFFYVKMVLDYI